MYIHLIGTADGCTLEDILVFFTGSSSIPPHGFGKKNSCTVTFISDGKTSLPTASTCNMELRLPTSHGEDYFSFKQSMILALKGNDGFGQFLIQFHVPYPCYPPTLVRFP